jgi:hypothetical protein
MNRRGADQVVIMIGIPVRSDEAGSATLRNVANRQQLRWANASAYLTRSRTVLFAPNDRLSSLHCAQYTPGARGCGGKCGGKNGSKAQKAQRVSSS